MFHRVALIAMTALTVAAPATLSSQLASFPSDDDALPVELDVRKDCPKLFVTISSADGSSNVTIRKRQSPHRGFYLGDPKGRERRRFPTSGRRNQRRFLPESAATRMLAP